MIPKNLLIESSVLSIASASFLHKLKKQKQCQLHAGDLEEKRESIDSLRQKIEKEVVKTPHDLAF